MSPVATEPSSIRIAVAASALGITQIIGWGCAYYAPTVLGHAMAEDTGWGLTAIFAAYSWAALVSGVASRHVGALIDRRGPRLVMTLGSVAMACGLALVGLAQHWLTMLFAWTIIGASMRAVLYEAAFTAVTYIAAARSRAAISAITLWGGLSSTVFWPLGHQLGQALGWRNTFLIYAALNAAICAPLHWWVNRPSQTPPDAAQGLGASTRPTPPRVAATTIIADGDRDRIVFLLGMVLALYTLVFATLSAHLVSVFEGLGLAAASAVSIAMIKGVAQTAARLLEMSMQRWFGPIAVGVVAIGLLPVAMLGFELVRPEPLWIGAVCVIYGAANGLVTIVRGAVPLALFGSTGYGTILGRIAAPGLIAAAIAPTPAAWMLEHYGARPLLIILTVISSAGLIGMLHIAALARRAERSARQAE